MDGFAEGRPDPDFLLSQVSADKARTTGRLKVFFGYAAGVGKTYAMLDEAQELYRSGLDVVVGYIEPHTRPDTLQLLEGLPVLPPRVVEYRNIKLNEFDLDAALLRKPRLILVDELAHTNAAGMRNRKRYQDVEELLKAGIDVFTTVNVQHIESLNDKVRNITRVSVRETIPDSVFDHADQVELIDFEPDELLQRFRAGKIYRPERATTAMDNFFTKENLRLLREIAMRKAADRLSHDNQSLPAISEKMASIRLMACVSASPDSARVIRWTSRTADAFHAPWVAVYVENIESQYLSDKDKKQIRENLEMATRMGAETVTLTGKDVAATITEYARLSGITNIVIGKGQNRGRIRSLLGSTIEDRLMSRLPDIEVHIIPGSVRKGKPPRPTFISRFRQNLDLSWQDAAKTFLILILATLLSLLLQRIGIGEQNIVMVYILSVMIVARITTGYVYSTAATIMSVLVFNFFFIEPYYTFMANRPGDSITFLVMFLAGLITSALSVRLQTQARLAVLRERRTEVLFEINKKLLATRGIDNIVALVNETIARLFDRSVIFYAQEPSEAYAGTMLQSDADPDASFLLSSSERAVAHWTFTNQKLAGAGTDTLMGAAAMYVPAISQGKTLGVIGLSCARGSFSQTNRLFLQTIVSQVSMALERQSISDEHRRVLVDSEKERMRGNLLRAISHDLRTPLTGILGASTTILDHPGTLDQGTHDQLISHIRDDAHWLIRMVENLLSVTRIDEGTMNVRKTPEVAEEIVAEAISRIRTRYPGRRISVRVPDQPLTIPMDGILIEQVLMNLLDNAIKHSADDSEVRVNVRERDQDVQFEVEDDGEGIAACDLPDLFERYNSLSLPCQDSARGMGIGLSVCHSIVKAHDGQLEAFNRGTGGALFRFSLPLKETGNDQR